MLTNKLPDLATEIDLMSNKKDVEAFLGRLESTAESSKEALKSREELNIAPYAQRNAWPGEAYVYIGHSSNLDNRLIGTEKDHQRKTCLALLFETKSDKHFCVSLEQAFAFGGFSQILSRFERDFLTRMPEGTIIGPAYSQSGEQLHSSFTIWQTSQETSAKKVLVQA